ncbi:MAG TPA: DUF6644 family protein [Pyrinomonadaceae bacterium]|jgi:hypothetical protein
MQEETAQTWLEWLEASGAAVAMREWTLLYPSVEIAHIVGFVVLVGGAFLFDLRLLGWARQLPVSQLAQHLLRWSRASLVVVVPTGLLMFTTNATKLAVNPVFQIKLALIAAAGVNAAVFRLWSSRSMTEWDTDARAPLGAKMSALLSIVLWTGVISCGRLIAYF